jgi:hypothetical protein
LSGIIIPASVTFIDGQAFLICTGITNITIFAAVMPAGQQVFFIWAS